MADYLDLAEIIAGKVLSGEIAAGAINPSTLPDPYNVAVKLKAEGKGDNEIVEAIGIYSYQTALTAAEHVNGLPLDYPGLLERSAVRVEAARELAPLVRKLEQGEDIDGARARKVIDKLQREERIFTTLDKVEPAEEVWVPTFYPPIDEFLGGVPAGSLSIIGGPPGTGKTSLMGRMLMNSAIQGKQVAFFSLEMQLRFIMMRLFEINPKLTKKARANIHATSGAYTINEIYSHATRLAASTDLHMIGIDFADMIRADRFGSEGVARVDEIYRTMADLALTLDVPVVVLSQLNEGYIGGRPRVNHLRGSRLIEALGALILLLYNPSQIDADQGEDKTLKWFPDTAYLIASKSRYGFHGAKGYGAIQVDFDGATGWGEKGHAWLPLGGS